MPTLHVYGIDHSRTSLDVREELAFGPEEIQEVLPRFVAPEGRTSSNATTSEAFLLSTCNRTEVYLVQERESSGCPLEPLRAVRPFARALDPRCDRYHLIGPEAVRHLYAVAASLRSHVAGDTQIAHQVAAAAVHARKAGTLGPMLEQVTAGALRSAKRVRRETGLMAGSGGLGPAVLQVIRRTSHRVASPREPLRVLLLGAGMMAHEVALHLLRAGAGSPAAQQAKGSVQIAGVWARDRRKASRFAGDYGACSLTDAAALRMLAHVDVVVGACRGRVPLLGTACLSPILEARLDPLCIVDLGVPRNMDPVLGGRDGLNAISLDQVQQLARQRGRSHADALERARQIVDEEAVRMDRWWRDWPVRPLRAELYTAVEAVLGRWRPQQPMAARHLRVALHRSLEQAFGSVFHDTEDKLVTNP